MSKDFRNLELAVIRWAEARKIIPNGSIAGQASKTAEEASELVDAAAILAFIDSLPPDLRSALAEERKKALAQYRDAVGDVVVTLINGCALADVDMVSCLAQAYDEIKDRKGTLLPNGVFVKEA
jgi:hypothetical protein